MLKKIFILLTIPLCSFSFSNIIRSFDDITKRKGLDERFKNTDYDEDVIYNINENLKKMELLNKLNSKESNLRKLLWIREPQYNDFLPFISTSPSKFNIMSGGLMDDYEFEIS